MKIMKNAFTNMPIIIILGIVLSFPFTMGCGSNQPIAPDTNPGLQKAQETQTVSGNRVLWGMWQFRFDLKNQTAEIVPFREAFAHVNVTSLLEPKPLTFLKIDEGTLQVDVPNNTIEVDVILTHPLPKNPEYMGFDVRGILITDGTLSGFDFDPNLVMSDLTETRLENADGYTRWWNPMEFTKPGILGYTDGKLGKSNKKVNYASIINGYKYFADGLGLNDDVMAPIVMLGRGRFSPSSTNSRHYSLKFGPDAGDFMVFNYAVDASWESPTNMPPTSLEDFPMKANCLEPFNIKVTELVNSLYYLPDPPPDCDQVGGVLRLQIDVASWQGPGGIGNVFVSSPQMGVVATPVQEMSVSDIYSAHVSTFMAEIVPIEVETESPMILIVAETDSGSYTEGPEGTHIKFTGPSDQKLALYQTFVPTFQHNSPPYVGPITGPETVIAGETNTYQVENYKDCQNTVDDLTFSWEKGDDSPPLYDDGVGNTDGIHPTGDGTIDLTFPFPKTYLVDCIVKDLDGAIGYSEGPLAVLVQAPDSPEFPVSGVNLELSLHRTNFNSYETIINPADIPYVGLSWDGSMVTGDIDQWVIYCDENPYDGLAIWKEIGTTPGFIWNFKNYTTGQNAFNEGGAYYYIVKARSIADCPQCESTGSTEYAFIEFENAEISGTSADQHPWVMGYGGAYPSWFRQWERPGEGGAITGGCWMMDPDSAYWYMHTWSVIASEPLPILTDPILAQTTEEWYIELIFGALVGAEGNECWLPGQRMSVGTVPDDPSTHDEQAFYLEYDESVPANYMDGTPYYTTFYWSYDNSRFDDTPATYNDRYGWGKDEFGWPFNFARYRLTDLDPAGKARTRAAIGAGSGGYNDALARPRADEIAVIIY
ncbi:MAG: hypothetical protein ABIC40_05515 [bacterium]